MYATDHCVRTSSLSSNSGHSFAFGNIAFDLVDLAGGPESAPSTWDTVYVGRQRARIREIVGGFAGLIDTGDVINDAVTMPVFENGDNAITRPARARERIYVIRMAFEEARAANPAATLVLND
jgi:hypothetical protein